MILQCLSVTCTHPEQDRLYGPRMRVHNAAKPKSNPPVYRCSVCLYERTYGAAPAAPSGESKKAKSKKAQR